MRRLLTTLLIASLAVGLQACVPEGEAPPELPADSTAAGPAAPTPKSDAPGPGDGPLDRADRPSGEVAKAPFDASRIPSSIDLEGPATVDRDAPAAPLELGQAEPDTRYDQAFATLARTPGTRRRGLDILAIEGPAGRPMKGLDVSPDGRASLFYGLAEGDEHAPPTTTHVIRVQVLPTTAAARDTLRATLGGYQATLEPFEAGDLGFAMVDAAGAAGPLRVLFVRDNIVGQVWSLDGTSVEVEATALDRLAASAPAGDPAAGGPAASLRPAEPPRAGLPTPLELTGVESTIVGFHFTASGGAAVVTTGDRIELLAPRPGPVEVEVVLFDRTLRRGTARITLDVVE